MIIKGFRFGMLLQIAVGPICLFVFQTAVAQGFSAAMSSVIGVSLIDALYILIAIWGLGTLLDRNKNFKKALQYFGASVLVVFGLSTIMSSFGLSIIPSLDFLPQHSYNNVFLKSLFLTLSNPLTILFWAGVFSTKIIEEEMNKSDMYLFGIGAVMSTLFFLSFVSVLGHFANAFLPTILITLFNVFIGFILILFGVKAGLTHS